MAIDRMHRRTGAQAQRQGAFLHVMIRFVVILAMLLLSGCHFVSYEDVSTRPEYAKYVGTVYRTAKDMQIYRVSMEANYGPEPSLYTLVPSPGFDGPEVLSRTDFPEGSNLRVLAVERCKDCYLDAEPRLQVKTRILSNQAFGDQEVYVSLGLLSSHMQALPTRAPGD